MPDEPEVDLKRLKPRDIGDTLYEIIGEVNFFIQTDNAIYGEDLVELRDALVTLKEIAYYIE